MPPPIVRGPMFPAFGGRGTERAPIAPAAGRELLNTGPRPALPIVGRGAPFI